MDRVTASITTLPERVAHFRLAFESIYPQVDQVNVVLDGHEEIPDFLRGTPAGRRVILQSPRPRGGRKKFTWGDQVEGYHFYVDDDIVYPPDYVKAMIAAIERHKRRAVVGVLGKILRFPMHSYMICRTALASPLPIPRDVRVHILGTGTMAHHTDTIRFTLADYPAPNMSDVYSAIKTKRSDVPMISIRRPAYWLDTLAVDGFSIHGMWLHRGDWPQTKAVLAAEPWPELGIPDDVAEVIAARRIHWPYRLRRIDE